jgi:hypothetical protein
MLDRLKRTDYPQVDQRVVLGAGGRLNRSHAAALAQVERFLQRRATL